MRGLVLQLCLITHVIVVCIKSTGRCATFTRPLICFSILPTHPPLSPPPAQHAHIPANSQTAALILAKNLFLPTNITPGHPPTCHTPHALQGCAHCAAPKLTLSLTGSRKAVSDKLTFSATFCRSLSVILVSCSPANRHTPAGLPLPGPSANAST